MPQALLHDLRVNFADAGSLHAGSRRKAPKAIGRRQRASRQMPGSARRAMRFAAANRRRTGGLPRVRKGPLRSPATNSQPCWATILPMATWAHHTGKGRVRARKQRSNLLEVWLELFEKIEGPRRRRAAEFRRRRDNPIRRIKNRSSQLRDYASLR